MIYTDVYTEVYVQWKKKWKKHPGCDVYAPEFYDFLKYILSTLKRRSFTGHFLVQLRI